MLGGGRGGGVPEEGVRLFQQGAKGKGLVVVEGIVPTRKISFAARINAEMANSLGAEIILVASPEELSVEELADRIEIHSRSEEHTSELQSRGHLVCRLLLEKKKKIRISIMYELKN